MSLLLDWNGRDFPEALRSLPAGRYAIEPVDAAPALTADEEAGLESALRSLREGKGMSADEAKRVVESKLRR
jgi:hypothetical protein